MNGTMMNGTMMNETAGDEIPTDVAEEMPAEEEEGAADPVEVAIEFPEAGENPLSESAAAGRRKLLQFASPPTAEDEMMANATMMNGTAVNGTAANVTMPTGDEIDLSDITSVGNGAPAATNDGVAETVNGFLVNSGGASGAVEAVEDAAESADDGGVEIDIEFPEGGENPLVEAAAAGRRNLRSLLL
uniref:Uncharacterized protein n=1 Tax=Chloropicon laureae TaxID=464258 RepID=A0A7S2Z6K9_9CHLO|mmetsp:Transcript_7555/g.19367  ORF Transcript_7555/g.19367 Transcript_7555/m.19367 type:complete len:188 (+) Transcript_7555:3-566(+)